MKLCGSIIVQILAVCATDVFYVLPDNSSNISCPSQPCVTLGQYVQDNNGTLPVLSNVTYYLLPGEHYVPPNMDLIGLYNFTIAGTGRETLLDTLVISCLQSFIRIIDSEYVYIANMSFKQCNWTEEIRNGLHYNESNLNLFYCYSCIIENVAFSKYGLTGEDMIGKSVLNNIFVNLSLTDNLQSLVSPTNQHAISLNYFDLPSSRNSSAKSYYTIIINNITITGHGSKCLLGTHIDDSGLHVMFARSNYNAHITVHINNSYFHHMDQTAVQIFDVRNTVIMNRVIMNNCSFEYNNNYQKRKKPFVNIMIPANITNCIFKHNHYWLILIQVKCTIVGSYSQNQSNQLIFVNIGAMRFMDNSSPLLYITKSPLSSNYTMSASVSGPIDIYGNRISDSFTNQADTMQFLYTKILITGPLIISKTLAYSMMTFVYCEIIFSNEITFTSNMCSSIIKLYHQELNYISITQHSTISFTNNTIEDEIITLSKQTSSIPHPFCCFQYILAHGSTNETAGIADFKIIILDNFFPGKTNDYCKTTFYHFTSHCKWISKSVFHGHEPSFINAQIMETRNPLIHQHTTLCLCQNNTTIDCSKDELGPVYPGQKLSATFCLPCSDKSGATLYRETHNVHLPHLACKIAHGSSPLSYLNSSFANRIDFNLVSNANETCELFLTVTPYLHQVYEAFNVKLLPCPVGFLLDNGVCGCDPILMPDYIDSCDIDQSAIHRPADSWIIHSPSNNTQYLVCSDCPMDYCLQESSYLSFLQPDTQCQFNRTGILCSQCPPSLSMVFGSSRCVRCSNFHALFSIAFLAAGVLLVALLYILNLTVANGTINGIIFYANIIGINGSTFLATKGLYKPLTTFMSFLNLDIGIELCFYNGMSGYVKFFLQLLFPAYLIIIAIFIARMNHPFAKISRWTLGRSHPVIATLLLLCYVKLLKISVLGLFSYSTITQLPSGHQQLVWSVDTSIPFLD